MFLKMYCWQSHHVEENSLIKRCVLKESSLLINGQSKEKTKTKKLSIRKSRQQLTETLGKGQSWKMVAILPNTATTKSLFLLHQGTVD